jgi:hypothetical protein
MLWAPVDLGLRGVPARGYSEPDQYPLRTLTSCIKARSHELGVIWSVGLGA